MKKSICIIVPILLCTAMRVNAQQADIFPPPAKQPEIYATRTSEALIIDGRLNEAAWRSTPVILNFFQIEPNQGAKPSFDTEVRILYDKRFIYFGVYCKDTMGKEGVRIQDFRRDFQADLSDVFSIQLDPQNQKQYCVSFHTTPVGTQSDLQVFNDNFYDANWDALWRVKTSITDSGWYAEYAIPFVSLRYNSEDQSADSAAWGVTFSRIARRTNEETSFPARPQAFSRYRMTYAAALKGLQVPPKSLNLRVQPYTLFEYDRDKENGKVTDNIRFKAGGEIKYAPKPNALLDITFNTDFAQTDVDRQVVNLRRFNVLFPERRQFFLENSGIYAGADNFDLRPYFSRAIGLDNEGQPIPINAGVRYTERNDKFTVSGMYVNQQRSSVQGASNFGLLRYLKNYGTQNNVGVMMTHRYDQSYKSKGFSAQNNTTLTFDGIIRPNDQWTIQYMLTSSRTNSRDSIGFGGSFYAGRSTNKASYSWFTNFIGERYYPAMGFISRSELLFHSTGAYFIVRPKWRPKWIRRMEPGINAYYYQSAVDFSFQEASLYIFPVYLILQNGGLIEFSILPNWQNLPFDFDPIGVTIAKGRYQYNRYYANFSTDPSAKVSVQTGYEWGGYYNGRQRLVKLGFRLAPDPHATLRATWEYNDFRNLGIQGKNLSTHLLTTELRLAFNPRLLVSGFYQYNSLLKQNRWNIRTSWEFRPLSFVYLIFNESNFSNNFPSAKEQSIIGKVTYLKQF